MSAGQHDLAKWYTRARRFPRLVGKLPDGTQIPFGPFTLTQVIGGAAVFFLAVQTMDMWGVFGLIGNLLILGTALGGAVFALGLLPKGAASPLTAITGVLNALSRPAGGTVAGRPVKIRPPHRVMRRIVVHHRTGEPIPASRIQAAAAVPADDPSPPAMPASPTPPPGPVRSASPIGLDPTGRVASPPPLTAVQQLLATVPPRKDPPR